MYNEGNFCVSKLEDQVLWPGEKEGKSEWEQVQLLAAAVGKQGELCSPFQKLGGSWAGWEGTGFVPQPPHPLQGALGNAEGTVEICWENKFFG